MINEETLFAHCLIILSAAARYYNLLDIGRKVKNRFFFTVLHFIPEIKG